LFCRKDGKKRRGAKENIVAGEEGEAFFVLPQRGEEEKGRKEENVFAGEAVRRF